jgi:hypothetical protein
LNESQLPKWQMVATAHQHGADDSGGVQNKKLNSPKEKRRKADKKSVRNGKATTAGQVA